MTKAERQALEKAVAKLETPGVTVRSYEDIGGPETVHTSDENAARLLESPDFKAGWAECHRNFAETLRFIMVATVKDLAKYCRD